MSRHDMGIGVDGRPLPYTPEQVREIVRKAVDNGEILLAIVRSGDALAAQVFGPPSREILEELETVTNAYRRMLELQS